PGGVSAQPLVAGPNVNISRLAGNHQEAAIAINPTNPNNLFAFSNTELGAGVFAAFSTDGGVTWTYVDPTDGTIADGDAGDPLPAACCDPSAAWDEFGNLFIAYLDNNFATGPQVRIALSTDGGQNFTLLATLGTDTDQETIVTGAGSVWVTYREMAVGIVAQGAAVTGLGTVGAFSAAQTAPGSALGNFGDIDIGPAGQVLVTYQIPSGGQGPATVFVNLDADGLGAGGFGAAVAATTTNVGGFDFITPQPDRSVDAEAGLACDRSGGSHNGRVYLVYTDETPNETNDTDIFVRFSDNDGATWSAPVRVHDDVTTRSQFLPRIALDQTTGEIAVSWHDSRNDDGLGGPGYTDGTANSNAQLFATISTDGGLTFLPNVQVSAGTSDEDGSEPPGPCCLDLDYGDYTGLAFFGGNFYPVWADNSNSTGDNPDGTLSRFDVYTAAVHLNHPPVANAGPDSTAECTGPGGASVTLDGTGSSDPDGDPLTFTWTGPFGTASGPTPTVTLPLGTHIITVDDGHGGTSSDTVTVTVVDTTPPNITSVTASPNSLWPPNHKLRPVTVSVDVSDICDAAPGCKIISVSSNEPVNGLGDGDTAPDWTITGDLTVDLRAERSGTGNGRVYTITVQCTDASGNSSTKDVTVTVPHDQR
ncbi:MAG: Ig-like domain-containing protein, partial [bacterium]